MTETPDIPDVVLEPALHFAGSSSDTSYTVDFATDIKGRLDTVHLDENGKRVFTISGYEKGLPSYFFTIRLLTDAKTIAVGEYKLTPDIINNEAFGFITNKGVGRFEYKGTEAGSLQVWTGTEWPDRFDSARVLITKNQDGYLTGEFSGRYTRTEVIFGDMKMNFTGHFSNIKTEF